MGRNNTNGRSATPSDVLITREAGTDNTRPTHHPRIMNTDKTGARIDRTNSPTNATVDPIMS
jgi:hypothetical protein